MLYTPFTSAGLGEANYYPWFNACDFAYRQMVKQAVNCIPFSFDFGNYRSRNTNKFDAFVSSKAIFQWSIDVFSYDDTVPLESSDISLEKITEVPLVVRGLGILCDEVPNDYYNSLEIVMDGIAKPGFSMEKLHDFYEYGTTNNSESPKRIIKKETSDTFTARYKESAFSNPAVGTYWRAGEYRRTRLLGGFLDASVWVDDIEKLK